MAMKLEGQMPIPTLSCEIVDGAVRRFGASSDRDARRPIVAALQPPAPRAKRIRRKYKTLPLRPDWRIIGCCLSRSDLAVIDEAVVAARAAGDRRMSRSRMMRHATLAWLGSK